MKRGLHVVHGNTGTGCPPVYVDRMNRPRLSYRICRSARRDRSVRRYRIVSADQADPLSEEWVQRYRGERQRGWDDPAW